MARHFFGLRADEAPALQTRCAPQALSDSTTDHTDVQPLGRGSSLWSVWSVVLMAALTRWSPNPSCSSWPGLTRPSTRRFGRTCGPGRRPGMDPLVEPGD